MKRIIVKVHEMGSAAQDEVTVAPLLVGAAGVGRLLGVSVRQVWAMHQSGALGPLPVKLGARTLWRISELQEWTEADCPHRERWQDWKKSHKNSVR